MKEVTVYCTDCSEYETLSLRQDKDGDWILQRHSRWIQVGEKIIHWHTFGNAKIVRMK